MTDGTPPGAYQTRFRDYGAAATGVRELYRLQHRHQTVGLVQAKRREFLALERRRMTIREAIELLDQLVDESDPDTQLSQLGHLLQTAEAIRAAGHPRWLVLTGLVHDLGKVLCLFGEPQWAVVGDTFPVGCRFAEEVVHHELFADNPDLLVSEYQTPTGIYANGIGLEHVLMSWGHDEYLYHVLKDRLPEPALYAIRYHSFYAAHRDGAYDHLMNDRDREMFAWVRAFSGYDLDSKADVPPDARALWPYYDALIAEFVPGALAW